MKEVCFFISFHENPLKKAKKKKPENVIICKKILNYPVQAEAKNRK